MNAGAGSLVPIFSSRAEGVGAVVVATTENDLASRLREVTGVSQGTSVGASMEARAAIASVPVQGREASGPPSAAISFAPLGIAETGSVVLAESTYHDRLTTLLCERHVVVLRSKDIVPSFTDVIPWLRESGHRYVTFATGPSRTSDIERVLTIGVHGPRELVIVLVS